MRFVRKFEIIYFITSLKNDRAYAFNPKSVGQAARLPLKQMATGPVALHYFRL